MQNIYISYSHKNMNEIKACSIYIIMERILCVCLCVTSFQIYPFLSCFKSEFDDVNSKLGLLIEYIKTRSMHHTSCIMYHASCIIFHTSCINQYIWHHYMTSWHMIWRQDKWRHDIWCHHVMIYDVMTYDVMTYDVMLYDVMTYDIMT